MKPIYFWVICYLMPVLLVLMIHITFNPNSRVKRTVSHLGLILSILLSQYFMFSLGTAFPFRFSLISISLLLTSFIVTYLIIGKIGILYSVSAFLQQLTMISMAFLLLPYFSLIELLILIVPIYAVSHLRVPKYAITKLLITMAFGSISILLFVMLQDMYYPISLHILGGALLLRNGVIYPSTRRRDAQKIAF